jgi:uncharacterized membrane protein YdjX (TVP38/TMEM64 family)
MAVYGASSRRSLAGTVGNVWRKGQAEPPVWHWGLGGWYDPPVTSPTETSGPRRALLLRVGLWGALGLLLLVAWRSGLLSRVSDVRSLTRTIADAGPMGQLAFVVAYTLLQPFGVPGTVFIIAAPLIWSWPVAFGLSMVGTMAASVVGFSFARFVAREWVARLIPPRLQRYDADLATHGLRTVFVLRLVLWMPQGLHALFGVSRVPFWTHFWGSLLGYILPLLSVSYLGSRLFDEDGRMQPMAWPVMGAMLVFSGVVWFMAQWLERRRSASAPQTVSNERGSK